jgi:hypothetical protein
MIRGETPCGWRIHVERPVRPMTVIVREVCAQDGLKMASSEDQNVIEALTPQSANKPLGERICSLRLDRGADDP